MFALCIIATYHKPHPHGIKVGVVGPPPQTAQLRAGLATRQSGTSMAPRARCDSSRCRSLCHRDRRSELRAVSFALETPRFAPGPRLFACGTGSEPCLAGPGARRLR
jgi:hypothetical protein